jgi:hypothetical protein
VWSRVNWAALADEMEEAGAARAEPMLEAELAATHGFLIRNKFVISYISCVRDLPTYPGRQFEAPRPPTYLSKRPNGREQTPYPGGVRNPGPG